MARSLSENITQAISDFRAIKLAVHNKGVTIPNGTKTSQYADYINEIDYRVLDYNEALHWLKIGEIEILNIDEDISIPEVLNSENYDTLLETQSSAAYAAFSSKLIAQAIKRNKNWLAMALSCSYKDWFLLSERNYLEYINEMIEPNPYITEETKNLVKCSHENNDYPAYFAFDNSIDVDDESFTHKERHIWISTSKEGNEWVQYSYTEPKKLYGAKIYSVRDNAPTQVTILATNVDNPTTEDFVELTTQKLSGNIGANNFDVIISVSRERYKTYRFIIKNSIVDEQESLTTKICTVGEIVIYTFKEDE